MSKLIDVTNNPLIGGGIFSYMDTLNPPWVDDDIALQLDMIYYGTISGDKITSPLIDKLLTNGKIGNNDMALLAATILTINRVRWQKEYDTLAAEYSPLSNYDMTETMSDDETITEYGRTHTRTDNLAHSETRTDNLAHSETRTDNLTHTIDNTEIETPAVTRTQQDSTRAFNSSSDVNTDKVVQSASGTNRKDIDGTERDTGTQGVTGSNTGTQATSGSDTGTQTDADTGSDTSTRNYTLTRSGNIGVTTSQQMLTSEREVWLWNYFYEVVFPDVDKVLTSPLYIDYDDVSEGVIIDPDSMITIDHNGEFNVLNYAKALVEVANSYSVDDEGKVVYGGRLISQGSKSISENGLYDTTLYNSCNVSVIPSFTPADEGKVVSNGALVSQVSRSITENGVYDTTLVNEIDVDVMELGLFSEYILNTGEIGVIDSIKGYEGSANNVQYSEDGVILQNASSLINIPNTWMRGMSIEIEIGFMTHAQMSTHGRLLMYTSDRGLIYRSNGAWSFYNGQWATDSTITDPDYFEDSRLTVNIDSDWYWHIYRNGVLVYEPDIPMTPSSVNVTSPVIIGAGQYAFYQCYIKKVSIYY